MQPSPPPDSVLPADWTQVLENIRSALTQALAETEHREKMLDEGFPVQEITTTSEAVESGRVERLDQGLRRFQASYQEAEHRAADVETLLQATQEAIQQWRTAATTLRERLARGVASSIK